MEALRVRLHGLFQSFRLPLAYKYQRTLSFPPLTTLFGMIGSCLGRDVKQTHCELPLHMQIACTGKKGAINRDLMSYRAIQGKGIKPDVVEREFIPFIELALYIAAEKDWLDRLEKAFIEPVGALVLGRADELITASSVERCQLIEPLATASKDKPIYALPGLYLGNVRPCLRFDAAANSKYETPTSFSLPNGFEYSDSHGPRTSDISKFREFTQLTSRWPINTEKLSKEWMVNPDEEAALQFATMDRANSG